MIPQATTPGPQEAAHIERQRHFIRAMSKSIEGQVLEPSERTLLEQVFAALMRGEDVSNLTGIRRPRARRSTDPIHIALHYLCLTRLLGRRPDVAWDTVGAAWGLQRRHVQRLVAQNREPALAALPRFADAPDRLLGICERHARGSRPAQDRPAITTTAQDSGNTLIRMLTQLLHRAAIKEDASV
jgi:hypothetical protein